MLKKNDSSQMINECINECNGRGNGGNGIDGGGNDKEETPHQLTMHGERR